MENMMLIICLAFMYVIQLFMVFAVYTVYNDYNYKTSKKELFFYFIPILGIPISIICSIFKKKV